MAQKCLIVAGLYFYCYHISGLATTNILRLTAGAELPILSSQCRCDNCGAKITPLMQMPIFSYIFYRGHCRSCGIKLPLNQLLLEISIFFGMSLIMTLFHFSFIAVTLSFLYYELVRIITIIHNGKRQVGFAKQYLVAVLFMLLPYLMTLFLSILYQII